MYSPAPFLISSAALTSILSFFFGNYFRQREKVYSLWISFIGYEANIDDIEEKKALCAELESKERVYGQIKCLLKILLFTIIADYVAFQFYSFGHIFPDSPHFEVSAWHSYKWHNAIIGIIVLINCLELLYIQVALVIVAKFPFIKLRKRVTTRDRLMTLWGILDCPCLKNEEINRNRIPESFYREYEKRKKLKLSTDS